MPAAATAVRAAAAVPPPPSRPRTLRGCAFRRAGQHGSVGRPCALPATPGGQPDPYALLGVPRGARRAQVRRAYLALIKTLHPDVSRDGEDTTAAAAALNDAYRSILEGEWKGGACPWVRLRGRGRAATPALPLQSQLVWQLSHTSPAPPLHPGLDASGSKVEEEEEADAFDTPEAEPSCLFVDPFACARASPYDWEALQHLAEAAAAAGADPERALADAGAGAGAGAVQYLSPRQLAVLRGELERAAATLDPLALQAAAWFVGDCLARARVANGRWTNARRRR